MKHIVQLRTNDHTMLLETNEAHCNHNQMKTAMKLQTNEAQYATGNKWRTLCKCKQMKHTMQLQTNEAH